MHQAILAAPARTRTSSRATRCASSRSSSSMPPQVIRELEEVFGAPLIEAYGMTEATHQMASNPLPPGCASRAASAAGGPEVAPSWIWTAACCRRRDRRDRHPGPNVTAGYENNPKANAEAFTDGWFRTGDQGVMDADGYISLTGRLKEIINRGGEKVSPREVDEILMDHPAVAQVVTFGMPHPKLGEEVAAAVVLREGRDATERELRDFAAKRGRLQGARKVLFLPEIPRAPPASCSASAWRPSWAWFNALTGGYDVRVLRDERSVSNPNKRTRFRLQVQGPTAGQIFERANGGPMPSIPFFSMADFKIGKYPVTGLNHRMSGAPGLEFWGPIEDLDGVVATLKSVGEDLGLRLGGARTYSTVAHESGWIPSPTPAIYVGDKMKAYREWLSGNGFEANASLGGSFYSERIEDYYQTPWDLGYGKLIKFDGHEFIGKQALLAMQHQPHRTKKWLKWNADDVMKVFRSMFNTGDRYKHLEMPAAQYATLPFDRVMLGGRMVGLSLYPVYTANVRGWFSLAMIDEADAKDGTEVEIVWGEENGGSRKPVVERHVQTTIRARIASSAMG
jgi:vanillate/3-O-methylgallate O-demethylase